ncbi:Uncharacterized protein FKW44_002469 [Caligus rogercresseyi]|uniref:Uncharacterized protein n=1 Tax=Caligus rogercresseyi TaxID=217165 RepID=A0A7T8KK82_CALRO|nr:Uncharacterized protein FKW44_002469 [Caligus rogercresseyi]
MDGSICCWTTYVFHNTRCTTHTSHLVQIGSRTIYPCSGRRKWALARRTATVGLLPLTTAYFAEGLHCGGSGKHEQGALVSACKRFWSRLEAVIEADGGWLE